MSVSAHTSSSVSSRANVSVTPVVVGSWVVVVVSWVVVVVVPRRR